MFVFAETTRYQNSARLKEMAGQTLLRAERAADYAIITLSDIIATGNVACNVTALRQIRSSIYLRGVVKDIRVVGENGVTQCSGTTHAGGSAAFVHDPESGMIGSNPNIAFYMMGVRNDGLIGIGWRQPSGRKLLAVLNVDSLMFDVFPLSLRASATASMKLGSEQFAEFVPIVHWHTDRSDWAEFSASSSRFPISTTLSVDPQALASWNREAEPFVLAIALMAGIASGLLTLFALARTDGEESVLRRAVERDEFIPYLQPIFSLDDFSYSGAEVLIRWQQPDGTVVPPSRFISLAEQSGLIVPMTWNLMRKTLKEFADRLEENPTFRLGFNVTPDHLLSEGFFEDLSDILLECGVRSSQVVIELTERQEFVDIHVAREAIARLREAGFGVSLDDTGTGHNGLSNVHQLGVDVIKIDKHFVDMIGTDAVAEKIIDMLVRLGADLGVKIIAEGIETQEQVEVLRGCGVLWGQGYLVAEPKPIGEFLELSSRQPIPFKRNVTAIEKSPERTVA